NAVGCITGPQLRRFVKNDRVESHVPWKKLADREGAHHETGKYRLNQLVRPVKKLTSRHVLSLLFPLTPDDSCCARARLRPTTIASINHPAWCSAYQVPVQPPELFD